MSARTSSALLNVAGAVVLALVGAFFAPAFVVRFDPAVLGVDLSGTALPRIQLWLLLISVEGAFWGLAAVLLCRWYREVLGSPGIGTREILARVLLPLALLAGAAVALLANGGHRGWPPTKLADVSISNLPVFANVGIGLAAVAVAGMLLVGAQAHSSAEEGATDAGVLVRRRELLDGFLLIASLILGLGVLATAALRDAYNAQADADFFAPEYVIIYGGFYSMLLGIAYATARAGFIEHARCIRRAALGEASVRPGEIAGWGEARESLDRLLGLRFAGLPALGETFSVLAPLVVGAISALLAR